MAKSNKPQKKVHKPIEKKRWRPIIWLIPTSGVIAPHVRNGIAQGLVNLGCKILSEDWGDMLDKIWTDIRTKPHWRDLLGLKVLHNLKQRGVDLMMCYSVNFCIRMEQMKEIINPMSEVNFPSLSCFFDSPYVAMTEFSIEAPKLWRNFHTTVWDEYWKEDLIKNGYREPALVALGTDPLMFAPMTDDEKNDPNNKRFASDVSFVGTYSEEREKALYPLADFDLAVWGNEEWARSMLAKYYRGPVNYLTESKYVYQLSKINLNVDMAQLKRSINNRVFDVLVGGGFLITEDKEDIYRLFKPGEHVVVYKNPDELPSLVHEWLEKPEMRYQMGQAGRIHVLNNHTWTHRAYEILLFIGGRLNWDLSWLEDYKHLLEIKV